LDAVELVAAVTMPPSAGTIREIPVSINWLQIRSDLIGDIPADWLRLHFPGRLLYLILVLSAHEASFLSPHRLLIENASVVGSRIPRTVVEAFSN
jgi:hypothetical protein